VRPPQTATFSIGLVFWLGVAAVPVPARTYTITPLDPPPGYSAFYPGALNSDGQVAGTAVDGLAGEQRAAIWADGTAVALGTLGGQYSGATAISDAGAVVGESWTDATREETNEVHAFVWDRGGMHDLGLPGRNSGAAGINSAGVVVGYESDQIGIPHAMLWDGGVGERLDHFERGFSSAVGINQLDEVLILGYIEGAGGSAQSYLWSGGALARLGAFQATGLSGSGQIIGYLATPLPEIQGVVWETGRVRDLGTSTTPLIPIGINDWGQIVGDGTFDGEPRAFLLTPSAPNP